MQSGSMKQLIDQTSAGTHRVDCGWLVLEWCPREHGAKRVLRVHLHKGPARAARSGTRLRVDAESEVDFVGANKACDIEVTWLAAMHLQAMLVLTKRRTEDRAEGGVVLELHQIAMYQRLLQTELHDLARMQGLAK